MNAKRSTYLHVNYQIVDVSVCHSGQCFRGFERHYDDVLSFKRAARQEGQHWKSVNAEALTTHFVAFEKLVRDYHLDSTRIWNLDESGGTPGRDTSKNMTKKRYMRRDGCSNMKIPEFVRTNRYTIMAIFNASGDAAPQPFVFKANSLPYRKVLVNGVFTVKTYASHLPSRVVMALRNDFGGVCSANFSSWAIIFVEEVRPLTHSLKEVARYSSRMRRAEPIGVCRF